MIVAHLLVLATYAVAAALLVAAARAGDAPGPARRGRAAAVAGAGAHVVVVGLGAALGVQPGFAASLSGLALAVALVVAALPLRLGVVAALLAPLAAGLQAASLLAPDRQVSALALVERSWWLPVHMALVIAAFALFLLELSVGAVQAAVRRRLKRKQLDGLQRLPALDVLDVLQTRALVAGVAALGLGIVVGAGWAAAQIDGGGWLADPKVLVSAAIWLWYALVLQLRVRRGWHGRWGVRMSAVGVLALVLSWVGMQFLAGGFHAHG